MSRSNLHRIFSTSTSPRSFFAYFPESYVKKQFTDKDRLTNKWPAALDLFRRFGKNDYEFSHYFDECLSRFWIDGDLRINPESFKDIFDETQKVHERVVVDSVILGLLEDPNFLT